MIKLNAFKLGFALLAMCIVAVNVGAQTTNLIVLQNQKLSFSPKEYYIADVIDGRKNVNTIGKLQPYSSPGGPDKEYDIDFKGGIAAVKNFMSYAAPVNNNLRPVVMKLKMLSVSEEPVSNGAVKGTIILSSAYYLRKEDDLIYLVDYNTKTSYQRRAGPAQQLEPLLRSALTNSIAYINSWMNSQASTNLKLAKSVKVRFTNYNDPADADTIYYSVNRPLKWDDFKGRPTAASKHAAEVFSSIGFDESVKIEAGIVNVTLGIKVYAPKSACWANPAVMTDDNLDHEQRHFDIAKIVSEHFKQNVLNERLPASNFDGSINVMYFDALRELDKMQKQYDADTGHSNNKSQQQTWDRKIDEELVKLGVKKPTP